MFIYLHFLDQATHWALKLKHSSSRYSVYSTINAFPLCTNTTLPFSWPHSLSSLAGKKDCSLDVLLDQEWGGLKCVLYLLTTTDTPKTISKNMVHVIILFKLYIYSQMMGGHTWDAFVIYGSLVNPGILIFSSQACYTTMFIAIVLV